MPSATCGELTTLNAPTGTNRCGEAQHRAPRKEPLAGKKAGRVWFDPAPQNREDAPRQLIEPLWCLSSVPTLLRVLSAHELNRETPPTTTEGSFQDLRRHEVRNQKESSSALILKAETTVLIRPIRHVLDLGSGRKNSEEAEREPRYVTSHGHCFGRHRRHATVSSVVKNQELARCHLISESDDGNTRGLTVSLFNPRPCRDFVIDRPDK
jgi:hypothetical protein